MLFEEEVSFDNGVISRQNDRQTGTRSAGHFLVAYLGVEDRKAKQEYGACISVRL